MVSKDLIDENNELFKKLKTSDPGLSQLRQDMYERFQIFWKNIRPRSIALNILTNEYVQYRIISKHNSSCDSLMDSMMELYLESLHKNKFKTIAVFSEDLGATPYYENVWSLMSSGKNNKSHIEDIRVRIREKLSTYKEFSEGMLKYTLPYIVTCLDIVQNKDTDFEKNSSYSLGNLISKINESKYPALEIITNTKTGLSINDLRNISAHSSIRTFPNNQIELTLEKNHNRTKIRVQEKDIDEDLQSLADIVFIIKFSLSLFAADNVQDLRRKLVPRSEDQQPEDAYLYLTDCFTKFQYNVEDIPDILDSLISVTVTSLTEKYWKDILVELSIHLPSMGLYTEMINKKNITKVRIIGNDRSGDEIGFVELSINSINELHLDKKDIIDVVHQIQFFDVKRNLLDNSFNEKAIKLIKLEESKINDLEKLGLI